MGPKGTLMKLQPCPSRTVEVGPEPLQLPALGPVLAQCTEPFRLGYINHEAGREYIVALRPPWPAREPLTVRTTSGRAGLLTLRRAPGCRRPLWPTQRGPC